MLTYYNYEAGRLIPVSNIAESVIVRAVRPSAEEISSIQQAIGIPTEFLSAGTDRDERPRTEIEEHQKLVIIRIPHHHETSDTPYTTIAFAVILTPTHFVTVCSEETILWKDLLNAPGRLPRPDDHIAFSLFVFLRIARQYLSFLARIRDQADQVEMAIHRSMRNEMLIKLLNLEKCLVFFTTSLRANEPVWERFRRIHGRELTETEQDLIDDVKIEFTQAKELADIYSNILGGTMDAFASIISNNLNVVLKFLTSVTIVLMIPTLVASIYGMNVELPFQHSVHAFMITVASSLVLSAVAVVLFLKKRWF